MNKGWKYDNDNSALLKLKADYIQAADSESDSDIDQLFEIWTENAGTDEPYYVVKTERWAVNDIDDLIKLLNDFKSRYEL